MQTIYLAIPVLASAGIFFGLARWTISSDEPDENAIMIFSTIAVIAAVSAVVMLISGIVQNLS